MDNLFCMNKTYDFCNQVQKNIRYLKSTFGKKFNIQYKSFIIPVQLKKLKMFMNNIPFYQLSYYNEERINDLHVFSIYFIDLYTGKRGKNAYISDIHKSQNMSGSEVVKFVLELLKKLHVKKVYLYDGASIMCKTDGIPMGLSLWKLIEKKQTFYMKFGFMFNMRKNCVNIYNIRNNENLIAKINELVDEIHKIKIKDVLKNYLLLLDITTDIIKSQDYDCVEVKYLGNYDTHTIEDYYNFEPDYHIDFFFNLCKKMIKILSDTKHVYLYDYMKELFNDSHNCSKYNTILRSFTNNLYIVKFKNKLFTNDNLMFLRLSQIIRPFSFYKLL